MPHGECVAQLTELGFNEGAATRALLLCGHDVEQAMNWLLDHPNEASASPTAAERMGAADALAAEEAVKLPGTAEPVTNTSLQAPHEGSAIVRAINNNAEIQSGLSNVRVLEAFHSMA